jgi:putative methionine-R-sulfoxide reductase with GAF domain
MSTFHPDIGGEQGVHRAPQRMCGPVWWHEDPDPLAVGMDPGIGATRASRAHWRAAEPFEDALHLPLNGPLTGLPLPPRERASIVLCDQEDSVRVVHAGKLHGLRRPCECVRIAPPTFPAILSFMAPRSLASLAHALGATSDLDGALTALAEGLAEIDRGAVLALLRYDARRDMLRERLTPQNGQVTHSSLETTFDHLPEAIRTRVVAGGQFIDVSDRSADYARLFGFSQSMEGGSLALRGLRVEGYLAAVLALYEPRKIFGTRTSERLAPSVALFDLAFGRIAERQAREEAVRTLEDVTQRVHGEYVRKLGAIQAELREARNTPLASAAIAAESVALQAEAARMSEAARRATRRAEMSDQQLTAAIGQLEQAHVELHRRSEALRQKTRTLYLVDRVLALDAQSRDTRALVDGLLALVGDDMQAQRCSLMLRAPDPDYLYIGAARGVAPHVSGGTRIRIGEGVAGRVAATREPLLVQDVRDATQHPLLKDQYFTTGSFISFPLVYHGELVGVVNLTNRAQHGVYTEEDVERVRLLGLVISLVASANDLAGRLYETIDAG